MWAGHCGPDWHLTGPLWRILPVYQELFLIGCLKSNFLLHVPVCSLAAWMSGRLAAAHTHIAPNTYTQRRAMFQNLYNWAATIVSVINGEAILCLSIIFREKKDVHPVLTCQCETLDACNVSHFTNSFFFFSVLPTIKLICICHIQNKPMRFLFEWSRFTLGCPVFLPKQINADCCGPQIRSFQGRFVCNFTLLVLVLHPPHPAANVWNDVFEAFYFYFLLCSKAIY